MYIASRDEKSLKKAAEEFNSKGFPGKCIPLTANLATYDGVMGLVNELEKREKCTCFVLAVLVRTFPRPPCHEAGRAGSPRRKLAAPPEECRVIFD